MLIAVAFVAMAGMMFLRKSGAGVSAAGAAVLFAVSPILIAAINWIASLAASQGTVGHRSPGWLM